MSGKRRPQPAMIRHRSYGTVYRIIRTTSIGPEGRKGALYWIVRAVYADGTEAKKTSYVPVSVWSSGRWEVVS